MPELVVGEGEAEDILIDSYAQLAGFKGHHAVKNVWKRINRMRPIKKVDGRPLTAEAIRHNNKSLIERLTDTKEQRLSEDNIQELKEKGYQLLGDLFSGDVDSRMRNHR